MMCTKFAEIVFIYIFNLNGTDTLSLDCRIIRTAAIARTHTFLRANVICPIVLLLSFWFQLIAEQCESNRSESVLSGQMH